MNKIKATFECKPDFNFRNVKVEKVIRLPDKQFEKLLAHPLHDYDFIKENVDSMYMEEGIYHCMLVTAEGHRDGLLIEAEGYGYARYASYVPDAASVEYDSLSELSARLSAMVHELVTEGAEQTGSGSWCVEFDEVWKKSELNLDENPFLRELVADMLIDRPEISDVVICKDSFEITYYLAYCPNCVPEQEEGLQGTIELEM